MYQPFHNYIRCDIMLGLTVYENLPVKACMSNGQACSVIVFCMISTNIVHYVLKHVMQVIGDIQQFSTLKVIVEFCTKSDFFNVVTSGSCLTYSFYNVRSSHIFTIFFVVARKGPPFLAKSFHPLLSNEKSSYSLSVDRNWRHKHRPIALTEKQDSNHFHQQARS